MEALSFIEVSLSAVHISILQLSLSLENTFLYIELGSIIDKVEKAFSKNRTWLVSGQHWLMDQKSMREEIPGK